MHPAIHAEVAFVIYCIFSLPSCGKTTGDVTYDFDGLRPASVSIHCQKEKYTFNGYITAVRSMPESVSRSFARSEAKSYIIQAISKHLSATDPQWITLHQYRLLTLNPAASGKLTFTAESYAELEKGPHIPIKPSAATEESLSTQGRESPPEKSQSSFRSTSRLGDLRGAFQETQIRIRDTFQEFSTSQRELMASRSTTAPSDIERFAKELEALHQFMKEDISKDIRLNDIVERPALYEFLDDQLQETFVAAATNANDRSAGVDGAKPGEKRVDSPVCQRRSRKPMKWAT